MTQLEPRILFLDIETCGVNALKSDLGFVVVFGYKWLGESRAHSIVARKKDLKSFSDKWLLEKASKLIEEADITVAHYGSIFDRRYIQGRLLINNLPPIPPTKMRDTWHIVRSVANFSSNRLKHLAKILSLRHQKLENNWPNAWFQVMQGDTKALEKMAEYCRGDVLALEELYLRLRPFDNPHPRIHMDRSQCGVCGGSVQYRGVAYVADKTYRRYRCNVCHHWGRDKKAIKETENAGGNR